MIYKVFYQETKERSPRRETTRSLYLDEYIELLSDKLLDYEKETGAFEITEF